MTYSLDFRKRVLEVKKEEDLTLEEVAKRFKVGVASVIRWNKRLIPQSKRNKPETKVNMEALKKDVKDYPDSYQYERAQRLGVSKNGIHFALKRLGVSYKKNPQSSEKGQREKIYVLRRDQAT